MQFNQESIFSQKLIIMKETNIQIWRLLFFYKHKFHIFHVKACVCVFLYFVFLCYFGITVKEIISQTDLYLVSLSSKTQVFEDKLTSLTNYFLLCTFSA